MNERNARFALAAAFFLYVLWMRTYDVATTFLMLGEQTRDWTIALGGLTDLPLVGAPSNGGGEQGRQVGVAFLEVRRMLETVERAGVVLTRRAMC